MRGRTATSFKVSLPHFLQLLLKLKAQQFPSFWSRLQERWPGMGKPREGMEEAIIGFVTVTTAMPCLPTLLFVHFQPSDLQSILHLNPPRGFTQGLRGGFGEAITTAQICSQQSSTQFTCWIPGLESPYPKGDRFIKSGELYPKCFSFLLSVKEPGVYSSTIE